jgi:fructosamine-3-kinase
MGQEVVSSRRLGGGDINDAFAVTLADKKQVFVKTNANAPRGMFEAEARGLKWLGAPAVLRVPEVLATSKSSPGGSSFLVLELIRSAPRARAFDEQLGRGLAKLHRSGSNGFGLDHDNFIGRLPQDNTPANTWAEFYGTFRLEAQLRMASDAGLATAGLVQDMGRLIDRLPGLVGPEEPPSRLHGDLWGGNLHVDEHGKPCLIDPAVYGGHREMDLAMMRLFGGFGPGVFEAYEDEWPLSAGHEDRVPLYQLYPLMVHVNLFGSTYLGSVGRALRQLA